MGSIFRLYEWLEKRSYHPMDVSKRNLLGEETIIIMADSSSKTLFNIRIGDKILGLDSNDLIVQHVIKGKKKCTKLNRCVAIHIW